MELLEALKEGTDIITFFTKNIPAVYESQKDEFSKFSSIPVVICTKFDDGTTYTFELSKDGILVEDDEMIDFPILTIFGKTSEWSSFLAYTRRYADAYEKRKHEIASVFYFSQVFADAIEKFDLVFDLTIIEEGEVVMSPDFVLNNYEIGDDFSRVGIVVESETLNALSEAKLTPIEAAKELIVSGTAVKAIEFARLFLKFRPT